MKILIVTQARYGSTRLPGKILKKINNKTLLDIHLERLKKSLLANQVIVATTNELESKLIEEVAVNNDCGCYKGSLDDVLDRFYMAVKSHRPDYIVRVTSDCPLVDSNLIDELIKYITRNDVDYISNVLNPTYPDGFDCEVFTFQALERAWKEAVLKSDREHVTPYIWRNSTFHGGNLFKSHSYEGDKDFSNFRLCVDNAEDFKVIKKIVEAIGTEQSWEIYTKYLLNNKNIANINSHIKRNEGYQKSKNEDMGGRE